MTDLDRDLGARLERLAAAVPVRAGELDPVFRGAVEARMRVRMAWVTPLVAVAVVSLLASALGIGPFGSRDPAVVGTARAGDLELSIRSPKTRWTTDESIEVVATLTNVGSQVVTITHSKAYPDRDGRPGPLGFGMVEPVFGKLTLSMVWLQSRNSTALGPGGSISSPFVKSGSWDGNDPRSGEYEAFLQEPGLRLPVGTWHPYVVLESGLRAEIAIEVADTASVSTPVPTSTNAVASARWKASATAGDFELRLEAAKGEFASNETLDVAGFLTYRGQEPRVVVGVLSPGPITFSMDVPEGIYLITRGRWSCDPVVLARDVPMSWSLLNLNGFVQFEVPHGLYDISASADVQLGGCTEQREGIEASITVAVIDGPEDIAIWTDRGAPGACPANASGGILVRDPANGLGVLQGNTLRGGLWPRGFSAHLENGVAVLVDADGHLVAHEGDHIVFSGGFGFPLIAPCGGISVAPA